jgi:Zn ribbon nucleic-acid-binding protein
MEAMMRIMDKLKTAGRWKGGLSLFIAIGWALVVAWPALAQTAALTLSVSKTFGFNNGSQIQGSFRLQASGPADLRSVTFTLDGEPLGEVSAPPFTFDLNTDRFAPGWHTVGASGQTADGQTLTAADRRYEFLSATQAQSAITRFIGPILGIVGLLVVVGMGSQLFFALRSGKNRSALPLGAHRTYGVWGGAICPKCQRPFSIHLWGLNALPGQKFDRCDHCGKWSLVRRANPAQLAEAEAAELKYAQPTAPQLELSPEEKLKRDLDASRFDNS